MPTNESKTPPLSCLSCRQRKVKCDKAKPCSACQRLNLDCVYPPRVRLPRGRQGGSKARNIEITRRLNRLEGLVERLGGETALTDGLLGQKTAAEPPAVVATEAPVDIQNRDLPIQANDLTDYPEIEPIVQADGSRYLSSDFWTCLSGEVGEMWSAYVLDKLRSETMIWLIR